tara:strand:- start:6623 stop:7273 length:651 start_codon:yes stop_codon:yes gene_type:complete
MNNRQPGRRGRGRNTNNRPQSNRGGGSDRDNRIDSRTRGNAVQMLDKFKKMAQDAQVNGDRVQAEYYHQFADHYFRVNADTIARREEQRIAREGDNRGNGQDDSSDNDGDNNRGRNQQGQQNRQQRDDRNDRNDRDESAADAAPEEKKPVRSRRPRKTENISARAESSEKNGDNNGLDASVLPPAISASTEVEVEKKPARKKRVMKPRAAEESDAA